ncbi:MAG: hypothetical protein R2749_12700 [Acidimicrobiales bacterium]
MARGRETFEKRRLQKVRQERKAEKANRREQRAETASDAPDEAALMERFRSISEQHSAGALSAEDYEAERREIFTALGLGDDF